MGCSFRHPGSLKPTIIVIALNGYASSALAAFALLGSLKPTKTTKNPVRFI
jgi:hypothetical protein